MFFKGVDFMRKPIIAIDMDDTLVYLMKAIMKHHNVLHPDHALHYSQMVAFDESMLHPSYDKYAFLKSPNTYVHLELIDEHVVSEIKKLHEKYDVIIVTSAFPEAVPGKWEWMQKQLPFIPHKNFCTFSRKDLINADLLIDDAIHNVKDWVATTRPAIVPSHHWNQELRTLPLVTMVDGWKDMCEIVDNVMYMAFGITDTPQPILAKESVTVEVETNE
jgi:5'(3')-deoxyribonucleotidase